MTDKTDQLDTEATLGSRWSEPCELAREIAGGPEAVRQTLSRMRNDHPRLVADLAAVDHVLLLGTGASLAMARCAEALWRTYDDATDLPRRVTVLEALELLFARSSDLTNEYTTVIAVSKSGESPELLAGAEAARRAGARVIAVTAAAGSPLARAANDVVSGDARTRPLRLRYRGSTPPGQSTPPSRASRCRHRPTSAPSTPAGTPGATERPTSRTR